AREHAVADLAPAGPAQELDLAYRERREVVMEHELLDVLALVLLDDLGVAAGAERRRDQRLGLAAGEEGGAVGAGQETDLDRDRADLVEPPAVEAGVLLEHHVAQEVFLELAEHLLDLGALGLVVGSEALHVGLGGLGGGLLALELALGEEGAAERVPEVRPDLVVELGRI